MKKKIITLLMSLTLSVMLCACTGVDLPSIDSDTTEVAEEVEDDEEEDEEEAKKDDKSAEEVKEDKATDEANDTDAKEEKKEGSLDLSVDNPLWSFLVTQVPGYIDLDAATLIINEVQEYMELADATSVDAVIQKFIEQNRFWIACLEDEAYLFVFDGTDIKISNFKFVDGKVAVVTVEEGKFKLDSDKLQVVAGSETEYKWEIVTEGELVAIIITGPDNFKVELFHPDVQTIEEAEELAEDYVENITDPEEVIADEQTDISTLLEGYKGVSIVEAFIRAGLNPTLANRALFAEELGIEDYKGTAEQNLKMIVEMGGIVPGMND